MATLNAPVLLQASGLDYVLLDSGHGRKLEELGGVRVDRPEPQAVWAPALPAAEWAKAVAVFAPKKDDEDGDSGNWQLRGDVPAAWPAAWDGLRFYGRLTPFRHLGCFPDQAPQWAWLQAELKPGMRVLNLFGYTGVASLVAARAGAEVAHVDASKKALGYARENAELAGLAGAKIRWLCDDALAFALREGRRGQKYDVIVLDPPKYGRGPDGERWEFFADMPALLAALQPLLAPRAQVWLTAYALRASSVALGSMLQAALGAGQLEIGELVSADGAGRRFTNAMFAHWRGL